LFIIIVRLCILKCSILAIQVPGGAKMVQGSEKIPEGSCPLLSAPMIEIMFIKHAKAC